MRASGSRAPLLVAVLLAVPALAAGCAGGAQTARHPPSRTVDFLPGRAADVYPVAAGRAVPGAPVVLLLPGGAWRTADRTGLGPLAARLARAGLPAVNATYRAADDGVRFPTPVRDIACAAAFAAHENRGGPVVLLGHSSGAHLAAVTALSAARPGPDCRYPPARVAGLVGLAGPYDVRAFADVAEPLFGAPPDRAPALWRQADPLVLAGRAPATLRVLLLHGGRDTLVAPEQSRLLAQRLTTAGVDVDLQVLPDADHDTIYRPQVSGRRVAAWVGALPGRSGQVSSSTISMAPAGHSAAQMPQPLQ